MSVFIYSLIKDKLKNFRNKSNSNDYSLIIIKPISGWQIINFKELIEYRDMFYFLVWRDIKALYAQTILGFSWAILQPLIHIVIFTVIIEWLGRKQQFAIANLGIHWKKPARYAMYYGIIIAIFWFVGKEQQFIYFQF